MHYSTGIYYMFVLNVCFIGLFANISTFFLLLTVQKKMLIWDTRISDLLHEFLVLRWLSWRRKRYWGSCCRLRFESNLKLITYKRMAIRHTFTKNRNAYIFGCMCVRVCVCARARLLTKCIQIFFTHILTFSLMGEFF